MVGLGGTGLVLSREGHEELRARLVDAGGIKAFVQLLHRSGGQADGVIPTEVRCSRHAASVSA